MGSLDLVEGLGLDDLRPAGIGVHTIAHHDIDPATHEVDFHSSGLHPTDLGTLKETIAGLVAAGWLLCQLKLVVTEGVGGARMLAVLAKPRAD